MEVNLGLSHRGGCRLSGAQSFTFINTNCFTMEGSENIHKCIALVTDAIFTSQKEGIYEHYGHSFSLLLDRF